MSIPKVSVFCILLFTVASASLVAIRATNWNTVGLYAINETSGVVEQTGTWDLELTTNNPMLAQSPYSSSLIYFELTQQELSAAVIDTKSGETLASGLLYLTIAPYACGGATFASKNVVLFSCTYGGGFQLYALDINTWKASESVYINTNSQPLFGLSNPTNSNELVLVSRDQKNTYLESDHVTVFNLLASTSTICKAPFTNSTISQPIWNAGLGYVFLIQHPTSNSLGTFQVSVVTLSGPNCQWNVITSLNQLQIVPSTVQVAADEPNTIVWLSPNGGLYSYDLVAGSVSGALLIEQGSNKIYSFAALLELP